MPHSLYELEVNNRSEKAAVGPVVSQKAIFEVRSRAKKCLAANGGHF